MEQCKKYIAELRDLAQRMSKLYGVETLAFIVPRYQDDVSPATKATVHSIDLKEVLLAAFLANGTAFCSAPNSTLLSRLYIAVPTRDQSTGDFTPQKKMIWSTQGLKALETSPKQTVAQLKAIIDDLRHGHLAIVPSVDPNDNTEAEASDDDSNGGEGPLSPRFGGAGDEGGEVRGGEKSGERR
ncbi:BZ3500_MvSof-1268-A1-R1_C161g00814 [Microbotryum saponariae]|uniref:BZ3500_MvSof-1268-A1-R1_C161g00814 protein n=1 Tax=Microbotryum saponariae TaxID=289078 RepID=A0A2X0KPI1_9BASI|nr:BZ3500_MvSof-1268-A1-R1_C161g00814 [Microbotryum saponariae]